MKLELTRIVNDENLKIDINDLEYLSKSGIADDKGTLILDTKSKDYRYVKEEISEMFAQVYQRGYSNGRADERKYKSKPEKDGLPKGWIKLPCDGVMGDYICNVNNIQYLFPYQDYTDDWVTQVAFANNCDTVTVKMQHDTLLKMIEKAQEELK